MKKWLTKIKQWIDNKGLIKVLAPALILVLALVVLPNIVGAEATETAASKIDEMKQGLVGAIVVFHAFIQALLYPMVMIASALMDNNILLGPEMEASILEIWVQIRNWVNIIFVLVLVGIALYNVMGIAGDGSNYALKAILPKIVIGLVAINFSFLAGKVMIDSVGVLTEAVYALPTSFTNWDGYKDDLEKRLCRTTYANEETGRLEDNGENSKAVKDASVMSVIFCESDGATTDPMLTGEFNNAGSLYFSHFGEHNATASIMINMGLINDADMVALQADSGVDALSEMALHALFGVFMFLLFGFAYAALIVVLIARLIILWICLALSPLIVLFFVFPDLANAGGGEVDLKDKFFKHLFVPLVIGVVFSIGFTMLSVLYDSNSGSWMTALGGDGAKFGKFTNLNMSSDDVAEMQAMFGTNVSDFQSLLIAIGAVLIIWIGVFAAADQTVASSFTSSIKSAGEGIGKFAAKLPLYMTTIPIPGTEDKAPLMSAFAAAQNLEGAFKKKMGVNKGREKILERMGLGDPLGRRFREASDDLLAKGNDEHNARTINEVMHYKGAPGSKEDIDKLMSKAFAADSAIHQEYERLKDTEGSPKAALERMYDTGLLSRYGDSDGWGEASLGDDTPADEPSTEGNGDDATGDGTDDTSTTNDGTDDTTNINVTLQAANGGNLSTNTAARDAAAGVVMGATSTTDATLDTMFEGSVSGDTLTRAQAIGNDNLAALNTILDDLSVNGGELDAGEFTRAVTNAPDPPDPNPTPNPNPGPVAAAGPVPPPIPGGTTVPDPGDAVADLSGTRGLPETGGEALPGEELDDDSGDPGLRGGLGGDGGSAIA